MDFTYSSYLVPIAFGLYGLVFLFRTPEYLSRTGLTTFQTRRSEKIWKYGHRVAGIYCVIAALISVGLGYLQNHMGDGVVIPGIFWIRMIVEVLVIAWAIPVVNIITGKRFPGGKRPPRGKK